MKINETQTAMLVIQLAALGQADLADNDLETLLTLEHMISEALNNVRKAMEEIGVTFHQRASDAKS